MSKLKVGDLVVAVKRGGQDHNGLPERVPQVGMVYRITGIYSMAYGAGCTLEGMDPRPYKGFFLYVDHPRSPNMKRGWYFRKAELEQPKAASGSFADWLNVENANA